MSGPRSVGGAIPFDPEGEPILNMVTVAVETYMHGHPDVLQVTKPCELTVKSVLKAGSDALVELAQDDTIRALIDHSFKERP